MKVALVTNNRGLYLKFVKRGIKAPLDNVQIYTDDVNFINYVNRVNNYDDINNFKHRLTIQYYMDIYPWLVPLRLSNVIKIESFIEIMLRWRSTIYFGLLILNIAFMVSLFLKFMASH